MRLPTKSLALAAAAVALAAGPALAQMSKDTLRVALHQPIRTVDSIFNPHPETTLMSEAVFDTLIHYDAEAREYRPSLATSWTMVDDTTIEFKLREDVKFHDGSDFDADDVVYTVRFVTDPTINFRFKESRFGWIAGVEKVDRYTVRLKSDGVHAPAFSRISSVLPIYPSDVLSKLENKSEFGKAPVGTGPYKVASFDTTKGVVLERNDSFKHGGPNREPGMIKRIEISSIPDMQTQVAKLMTGELDMLYGVDKDQAQSLGANPELSVTIQPSVSFTYILFDSADRSKFGVLTDKRVRQALLHAIDREALAGALLPAEVQKDPLQEAMCHPWHIGCAWSAKPPQHDLDKAKQLLADAGHAGGFDLEITTWGPSRLTAEAVAGQLRKVGVRARIDAMSIGAFVKKRAEGKVQTFVSLWDNGGAQPDVESTVSFFFAPGSRNYMGDEELAEAVVAGQRSLDIEERQEIYRKAFDRATKEAYIMPLLPIPSILVHNKDLAIHGGHKSPEGFLFTKLSWK